MRCRTKTETARNRESERERERDSSRCRFFVAGENFRERVNEYVGVFFYVCVYFLHIYLFHHQNSHTHTRIHLTRDNDISYALVRTVEEGEKKKGRARR